MGAEKFAIIGEEDGPTIWFIITTLFGNKINIAFILFIVFIIAQIFMIKYTSKKSQLILPFTWLLLSVPILLYSVIILLSFKLKLYEFFGSVIYMFLLMNIPTAIMLLMTYLTAYIRKRKNKQKQAEIKTELIKDLD